MTSVSKATREIVRERAGRRCEYCRKPEGVSQFVHTIDHITALKHKGTSELDNLAWACFQCNSTKGSDIASYDNKVLTLFYNPRIQKWDDHFEMDGAIILGKTPINHPDQVEVRFRLIRSGHR